MILENQSPSATGASTTTPPATPPTTPTPSTVTATPASAIPATPAPKVPTYKDTGEPSTAMPAVKEPAASTYRTSFFSKLKNSKLLTIGILAVVGLFLGLSLYLYFGKPYSAPENIRITNLTSRSATVSWITEDATPGIVVVSEKQSFLPLILARFSGKLAYDDRDYSDAQLEIAQSSDDPTQIVEDDIKVTKFGRYYVHHVTLRNLNPESTYYFQVGNGYRFESGEGKFANEIEGFTTSSTNSLTTYKELESIPKPNPNYGKVRMAMGSNVPDAIMYLSVVSAKDSSPLSAVVNDTGNWYIDISNTRDSAGEYPAEYVATDIGMEMGRVEAGPYGSTDMIDNSMTTDAPWPDIYVSGGTVGAANDEPVSFLVTPAYAVAGNNCCEDTQWKRDNAGDLENGADCSINDDWVLGYNACVAGECGMCEGAEGETCNNDDNCGPGENAGNCPNDCTIGGEDVDQEDQDDDQAGGGTSTNNCCEDAAWKTANSGSLANGHDCGNGNSAASDADWVDGYNACQARQCGICGGAAVPTQPSCVSNYSCLNGACAPGGTCGNCGGSTTPCTCWQPVATCTEGDGVQCVTEGSVTMRGTQIAAGEPCPSISSQTDSLCLYILLPERGSICPGECATNLVVESVPGNSNCRTGDQTKKLIRKINTDPECAGGDIAVCTQYVASLNAKTVYICDKNTPSHFADTVAACSAAVSCSATGGTTASSLCQNPLVVYYREDVFDSAKYRTCCKTGITNMVFMEAINPSDTTINSCGPEFQNICSTVNSRAANGTTFNSSTMVKCCNSINHNSDNYACKDNTLNCFNPTTGNTCNDQSQCGSGLFCVYDATQTLQSGAAPSSKICCATSQYALNGQCVDATQVVPGLRTLINSAINSYESNYNVNIPCHSLSQLQDNIPVLRVIRDAFPEIDQTQDLNSGPDDTYCAKPNQCVNIPTSGNICRPFAGSTGTVITDDQTCTDGNNCTCAAGGNFSFVPNGGCCPVQWNTTWKGHCCATDGRTWFSDYDIRHACEVGDGTEMDAGCYQTGINGRPTQQDTFNGTLYCVDSDSLHAAAQHVTPKPISFRPSAESPAHIGQIASEVLAEDQATSTGVTYYPEEGVYLFENSGIYGFVLNGKTVYFSIEPGSEGVPTTLYVDANANGQYDAGETKVSGNPSTLSVTVETQAFSYDLIQGLNFVSFPFAVATPETGTASYLIQSVNNQYGDVLYSISYFNSSSGTWETLENRDGQMFGSDFQLTPGIGYVLKAKIGISVSLQGRAITSPVPVSLSTGWNLIAIHGADTSYTAESLLDSIDALGTTDADNVTQFNPSKYKYEGLQKSEDDAGEMQVYGFDFELNNRAAYFVRVVSGEGTWTPDGGVGID